jgi:hypothetical protein
MLFDYPGVEEILNFFSFEHLKSCAARGTMQINKAYTLIKTSRTLKCHLYRPQHRGRGGAKVNSLETNDET